MLRDSQHTAFNKKGEIVHSNIPIHPGEILKDEIEAKGIKKNFFAKQIKIKPSHLSELFKGKRNVSAELALKLEKVLEIEAEFWLRLQSKHDITIVRNSHTRETV